MKKYIFIILMSVVSNFGLAQSKTTTQSNTKSSESYNYTSTFDKSKTIEIFNYLKTEIGMNWSLSFAFLLQFYTKYFKSAFYIILC